MGLMQEVGGAARKNWGGDARKVESAEGCETMNMRDEV